MLANRDKALDLILASEGGWTESPSEPGGASMWGVSMVTYGEWQKARGFKAPTLKELEALTEDEAKDIYAQNFCVPIRFAELPSGVDYRLLDIAVNLGVHGGITLLHNALAHNEAGIVSDADIATAKLSDPRALVAGLGYLWLLKKKTSSSWGKYARGWTNREKRVTADALAMIGAAA